MLADNSNIFRVSAIVSSPSTMATCCNSLFISSTVNIIQPYAFGNTIGIIKTTALRAQGSFGEVQHSTNDIGFFDSPVVVAYCSPGVIKINFNSTFILGISTLKSYLKLCTNAKQTDSIKLTLLSITYVLLYVIQKQTHIPGCGPGAKVGSKEKVKTMLIFSPTTNQVNKPIRLFSSTLPCCLRERAPLSNTYTLMDRYFHSLFVSTVIVV